jgi:hypothetical protein
MTNRFRALIAVGLLLIIAFLPACYTLLKHPRLAEINYRRPDDKNCENCHSNSDIWKFNHNNKINTLTEKSGVWSEYYDLAWWYESRWNYEPARHRTKENNEN